MEERLILDNISLSFREHVVFERFSTHFVAGKINCILGPSGCGKTSMLNIISGLLRPDTGNTDAFSQLSISCVFQEPRLLPWKTVGQNIRFVLNGKYPAEVIEQQVQENLRKVELEKFVDYYPVRLSGGMKQRVALARAFAFDADLILMDEPFKALDAKLKYSLIEKLIDLWKANPRTVIFVSHDVDEVLKMGHSIQVWSEAPVKILRYYEDRSRISNSDLKTEIESLIGLNNAQ